MTEASSSETADVVAPPPALYAATFLVLLALRALWPLPLLAHGGWLWPGLALAAAAVAFGVWGRRNLGAAGTDVNPYRPTTAIVETGAYGLSRNPLYVGLAAAFLGLTLACNTAWGLVLFVPLALVMHHGVILREERYLEGKFGAAYRSYRARVRRYV